MTQTLTSGGFTTESFEAFLTGRDEPDWSLAMRREAWQRFSESEFPNSNAEEWRRTDLRLFQLDKFSPPAEPGSEPAVEQPLLSQGVELAGYAGSVNSCASPVQLEDRYRAAGVLFGSLDQLLAEHADLLRPHFMTRAFDATYDRFAALHAAFWSGGTLLYVPRGVVVDQPLHMISTLAGGGVDLGHTLVILEEGAQATLMAETASDDQAGLHCGAIELLVGPQAQLRYVNLQNWGSKVWHFAHQKAIVEAGGQLQWTIGALGSRLAKVNQHVELAGSGARAQVNGAMFTEGRQHLAYHTLQHHRAANCHSDLLYKGALQERSQVVWRGMIRVDEDAQKTDAYQRNDNLILSDAARTDSIPGLEIEADDVICTHGATAGRVDDEQIFYAQCRGFTRQEAVRMIVAGFFQKVFDRITIESVREALGAAIGRRIRQYD